MSRRKDDIVFSDELPIKTAEQMGKYYTPAVPLQAFIYVSDRFYKYPAKRIIWGIIGGVSLPAALIIAGFIFIENFTQLPTFGWMIVQGVLFSVIFTALLIPRKMNRKYAERRETFIRWNKESFLHWLKKNYNITYKPSAQEAQKMIFLSCYGEAEAKPGMDSFTDVKGNTFVLYAHPDGGLYPVLSKGKHPRFDRSVKRLNSMPKIGNRKHALFQI